MARIIDSAENGRRIIKLSASDVISIVQDYQRIVPRRATRRDAIDYLTDTAIYIPEDV